MGIIGKLVSKAVQKVVQHQAEKVVAVGCEKVGNVLDDVCDKVEKRAEEKKNKKIEQFLSEETAHTRLVFIQKKCKYRKIFQIFNENKEVKYIIKGNLFSSTRKLLVYDKTGKNKLGEVNKKRIALRSPFSLENHPQDFVVKIGGNEIGKIKSRTAFAKSKFEFDFNGWVIEGNLIGSKYIIKKGQELIMEVYPKFWLGEDTYFIDIFNPDNEILCLIVALVIELS